MGESVATLLEALEADAAISLRLERLQHYAGLRSSEDSSDAGNLAREGVLSNLLTRISEAASFFTPEIQAIPDGVFATYLEDERLAMWRIPLRKIRRFRAHTLSEGEER
jgi:oligoendopeptidase F